MVSLETTETSRLCLLIALQTGMRFPHDSKRVSVDRVAYTKRLHSNHTGDAPHFHILIGKLRYKTNKIPKQRKILTVDGKSSRARLYRVERDRWGPMNSNNVFSLNKSFKLLHLNAF